MINFVFLFAGVAYTTIIPGLVIVRFFLPKIALRYKIPLCFLFSVIVSTLFSYFAGLLFGLTRQTLFWCLLFFLILLGISFLHRGLPRFVGLERLGWEIFLGVLIYLLYFVALLPGIFVYREGNFVMSGPNWQDTAMHLSIIESLSQGNFPPQAPYFSGYPLSYYYFSDLHAAIVNIFYGEFFPQVLTLINPFMAMTFFFSVYALSFMISKNRKLSIIGGLIAVLYGNLKFFDLFRTLLSNRISYFDLVAGNPFHLDQKLFQMVPVSDYFLQNRPMMVGLPAFVLIILLLFDAVNKDEISWTKIILAGFITAALIKFQTFGFLVSWIFFGTFFFLRLISRKISFMNFAGTLIIFSLWSLLFFLIFAFLRVGSKTVFEVFFYNFRWEPWQPHSFSWFLSFAIGNLNIGLLICFLGFFLLRVWKNLDILALYLSFFVLVVIPFGMKFTLYECDMFKFFYFAVPLMSVLLVYIFGNSRQKRLSTTLFLVVLILSSLTSINLLFHSYLNKNVGYTLADYKAGLWIRFNTASNSVFVTMPTVHSAPTDIGGRLRIISYINWPYSHGFNDGEDNVFSRVADVERVYRSGDISVVRFKYKAKYIFYGEEEKRSFPYAGELFEKNIGLRRLYNEDDVEIYEIL